MLDGHLNKLGLDHRVFMKYPCPMVVPTETLIYPSIADLVRGASHQSQQINDDRDNEAEVQNWASIRVTDEAQRLN